MSELEKAAIQYAEDFCNQVHNVDLNMMKDYAKTDFIAGAEWYKEKSKAPEMLEMLNEIWQAFDNGWDDQLDLKKIKKLIVEAIEL